MIFIDFKDFQELSLILEYLKISKILKLNVPGFSDCLKQ